MILVVFYNFMLLLYVNMTYICRKRDMIYMTFMNTMHLLTSFFSHEIYLLSFRNIKIRYQVRQRQATFKYVVILGAENALNILEIQHPIILAIK